VALVLRWRLLEIEDGWIAGILWQIGSCKSAMLTTQIELPMEKIAEFCRRWKIARLEVFGSVLRDDFRRESDVDFLYTFAPEARWGWDIVTMEEELSALLQRPVDLVSREAVASSRNWIRREQILSSAHEIYSA
jgi:uncharacterized protein